MNQVHNSKQIPLTLAVWLARDTYDYVSDSNYISATTLLRSLKSVILSKRVPKEDQVVDIHDLVPSRIGTAIHDSIEKAWLSSRLPQILDTLGINQAFAVNPPNLEDVPEHMVPIYMEQRSTKELMGYKIGGKYDFVLNGTLIDFKSTSTFTYVNKTNNQKYIEQGSIYRWLNPEIITDDFMEIHYIFTDWKPTLADTQKDYPPARAMSVRLPLLSFDETEALISNKLQLIKASENLPEEGLTPCNDEELWRKESVFKYYNDVSKTTRSTKNFDDAASASLHAAGLKSKYPNNGVIEVKGQVVACKYCDAFSICKQKDTYIASGELTGF